MIDGVDEGGPRMQGAYPVKPIKEVDQGGSFFGEELI